MPKALYAFSGDPITYGHIDIVKRALSSFSEIVVGIGVNPDKKYMFTLEERTAMAKKAFENSPSVRVESFSGLVVDYAYEKGISVILRGVRSPQDFEYENILHQCGESQKLGIETFILIAKPQLSHISSNSVKAIQKEQGFIHEYVPLHVKQQLEAKISEQYIIGVTGEVGSGKSYISDLLVKAGEDKGIEVHNIDIDHIGHDILGNLLEPGYQKIRKDIVSQFGKEVMLPNGSIDRKVLGEIVFNNPKELKKLNDLMYTPMMVRLRRELYGKKGIIIFNAALIAETDLSYICNNNVILVKTDKTVQKERLIKRTLTENQINRRLASQYDTEQKKNYIEKKIKDNNYGKLWIIDNSLPKDSQDIRALFEQIQKHF